MALFLVGPVYPLRAGLTGVGVGLAMGQRRGWSTWRELVELQHIFLGSPELLEGGTYLWEQPWGWRGSWAPSMHLSLSQSQV